MGTIKLKNAGMTQNKNNTTASENLFKQNLSAAVAKEQWDDPAILKELTDRTNETSRHYKLNNGTLKSVISAEKSNYFDEIEQKWKTIDNSLLETGEGYESTCGKYKTKISKPEQEKSVKMMTSGFEISWTYLGKQIAVQPETTTFELEEPVLTSLNVEASIQGALQSKGSRAIYRNADSDTDIEYSLYGNNLKENIIVKEKAEEYRYLFALNTQGLKLRVSEDNESLELYTETVNGNGETLTKTEATIPSPFMYDADGKSSEDVYFELEPEMDGKYTFAVVASAEWMNAEERVFPVTIDPQIVTSPKDIFSYQVEYRSKYYSSSSGCGLVCSNWTNFSSGYLRVKSDSDEDYRTVITVNKDAIAQLDYEICSVKLCLKPYQVTQSGYCFINGNSEQISDTSIIKANITTDFRNAEGSFTVTIEPTSWSNCEIDFYESGIYAPYIEIEYLINGRSKRILQQFTLAGGAIEQYDVVTGDTSIVFEDIPSSDSILNFGISHIYKKSSENFYTGNDFRLSLNETLSKTGASALEADYVYTDALGMKYGFKDTYYYISDSGEKTSVDKSSVMIDADGKLIYTKDGKNYAVKKEQHTSSGLKAVTVKEGFINNKYIDERNENVVKAAQKLKQLQLQEYSNRMQEANNIIEEYKKEHDYYCLQEEYQAISQKLEEFSKAETEYLFKHYPEDPYTQIDLSQALSKANEDYIREQTITSAAGFHIARSHVFEGLGNGTFTDDDANDNQEIKTAFNYHYLNIMNRSKYKMQEILKDAENLEYCDKTIKDYLSYASGEIVRLQNELLGGEKSDSNIFSEELYTQVKQAQHEYDLLVRQMPLNYLTDGKIVKGFNEKGNLVSVFDNYDNIITIEYDDNDKIVAVYEGENKQIVFGYQPDGLLHSITDTRGRRTVYKYSAGKLQKILRPNGTIIALEMVGDELTGIKKYENKKKAEEVKPIEISTISKDGSVTTIVNKTGVSLVENQKVTYLAPTAMKTLSTLMITQENSLTTICDLENKWSKYFVVTDEDKVEACYEESDGKVISAELYDYVSYEKNNVQQAKRDSLYKKTFAEFSGNDFIDGDYTNTKLDEFNNPATTTTNARLLSDGTTQQTTVTYEYDDNHKCIKETAVVTIKEGTSVLKTYTQITAYNYNAAGNVVRKESYIEGKEEYTTGKSIEETVYDEKGNVVKTFTYNSLDSSSKFYTESEIAENGQVLAEYDETGENKTEYEYISGTNVVRSQKLPNGSKFAYGHDVDDTVTSISQSTEEGEENSTRTRYTCGVVTELVSGNNKVNYEYDAKRRLSKVTLNGAEYVTIETADATETTDETVHIDYIARSSDDNKSDMYEVTKNKRGDVVSVRYVYDSKTAETPAYAELYTNEYDTKNRLSKVKQGSTVLEENKYDELDRLEEHQFNGHVHTIEYSEYNQTAKETISFGGSETDKQEYEYTYDGEKASRPMTGMTAGVFGESCEQDVSGRNVKLTQTLNGNSYTKRYGYYKQGDHATNRVNTIYYGKNGVTDGKATYTYDGMGNIISVNENGKQRYKYTYDKLNRIISEKDLYKNKEVCYTYDNNGNILTKSIDGEVTEYRYKEGSDRLVQYGTETISYDGMGNPLTYRGMTCTWEKGRQLKSVTDGANTATYSYDVFGLRNGKTIGNETTSYIYENGKLLRQVTGGEVLDFYYGSEGVIGFKLSGSTEVTNGNYLYQKNLFGDITGIIDESGERVYEYAYGAFGKSDKVEETGIGAKNPFRYRGYYYDEETGLYYLKSRYYDPETGRFITIDDISYLDPETINGLNLYAYCGNNPVMNVDPYGNSELSTSTYIDIFAFLFQTTVSGTLLFLERLVKTSVRPNNIGIGKYAKIQKSYISQFSKVSRVLGKISTAVAILTVVLSVAEGINTDIARGYTADRIVSNAFTNLVVYGGITIAAGLIGSSIGAALGSVLPGVGTIIGAVIGFVVGTVAGFVLEIEIGGKSIIDHIRDGVYNFWQWLFG